MLLKGSKSDLIEALQHAAESIEVARTLDGGRMTPKDASELLRLVSNRLDHIAASIGYGDFGDEPGPDGQDARARNMWA